MADVFISYARDDRATVQVIANALAISGFSVWWDRELLSGNDFDEVIERELDQASCVIVCWSAASRSSRYVRDEARRADERNVLAPVQLDDAKLPLGFGTLHTEDLSGWQGDNAAEPWQRLIIQIEALTKKKARQAEGEPAAADIGSVQTDGTAVTGGTIATAAQTGTFALIAIAALAGGYMYGSGQQLGIMGMAVVLALMVFWLMQRADQDLHPHLKAIAARWMLPVEGKAEVNTPEAFLRLFEAVFGPKHFSWRCIWRSAVASTVGLIVMLLIFDALEPRFDLLSTAFTDKLFVGLLVTIGFSGNVIGDYLSLGQTRIILMAAARWPALLPILVLIDVVATFAVLLLAIAFVIVIVAPTADKAIIFHNPTKVILNFINQSSLGLLDVGTADYSPFTGVVTGASFSTAYLTSVWLWLILLISPIARLLLWSRTSGLSALGRLIDVQHKPFTALGYVMALIIIVIGGVIWGVTAMLA